MNNKVLNNRAWLLVLPMLVLVSFSAIIPLMTVVNYSVQDVLGPNARFFTGTEWFHSILNDSALRDAFVRQILFSFAPRFLSSNFHNQTASLRPYTSTKF